MDAIILQYFTTNSWDLGPKDPLQGCWGVVILVPFSRRSLDGISDGPELTCKLKECEAGHVSNEFKLVSECVFICSIYIVFNVCICKLKLFTYTCMYVSHVKCNER